MDLLIRIAGEAGQGVQTTGNLLVSAFAEMGLHVFAIKSYMSRIRGGLNWFDVRIGDAPLYAGREEADVLVALTDEALETLRPHVTDGGATLFDADPDDEDTDAPKGCLCIPLTAIAKETGGSAVMANAVAAGAVFALLGYDLSALTDYFATAFKKKGEETVEANTKCAEAGAERVGDEAGSLDAPEPGDEPVSVGNGTDAVGLAAATAGVKFAAAYPMTPATGVFTYLAGVDETYGIVVEQAEDEIAAVNMVCGATYAGVPALTMTSGGGFALMAEGLSLAGIHELPLVIILAQRPGPATGLPTRTAQQDLLFALHAGHGEFPRAVFAPGTPEQAYELTRRALETAHRYQTPVLLMTDQYLADLVMDTPPLDDSLRPIDRHIAADAGEDYVRYAVTDDGISPRALPGGEALVVLDSDAHTEDGHITEDLEAAVRLQDKRMRKLEGMRAEALAPDRYGPDDADRLLLCWGSTWGPCREAVDALNESGGSVAMLHFQQVWPLDAEKVKQAIGSGADGAKAPKTITVVEGNQTGQFRTVLAEAGVVIEAESLTQYDGLPFTAADIVERIKS
jgi:2-oxoglutarate ferredoxin oxidoreductase subunit alpha